MPSVSEMLKIIFLVNEMKNCGHEQGEPKIRFQFYNFTIKSNKGKDNKTFEQL